MNGQYGRFRNDEAEEDCQDGFHTNARYQKSVMSQYNESAPAFFEQKIRYMLATAPRGMLIALAGENSHIDRGCRAAGGLPEEPQLSPNHEPYAR
jgi:hypothetical protein